jgi:sugar transferase (PEP-CTERM/EpsH1 system associated)
MRVLFITHRLPCPPDRGCKVRSAAILHWLAERHDVWCAGLLDNAATTELQEETRRSLQSLRHLCRGVLPVPFAKTWAGYKALAGLARGGTATEGFFHSRALERGVTDWSNKIGFDAVFAFSSGIAPLALAVRANRRVLCMDDLDSCKWDELAAGARWPMRTVYGTEAARLARQELEWIEAFDATLMVSQREADLVTDPRLRDKVHVVPPVLPGMVAGKPRTSARHELPTRPVVGFVGAMDYEPNIDAVRWFAQEIWPRVRRHRPDAQFWIVGRSPTKAVCDLARPGEIIVTGTVADVDEYVQSIRVHVAPLRVSRGVQIKVLSAMAAERPCVVTSGVAEGLGARPGRDLIAADSPGVFAQGVINLLENTEQAEALGQAGRLFLKRIDPNRVMRRVEGLLSGDEAPERDESVLTNVETTRAESPRECVSAVY